MARKVNTKFVISLVVVLAVSGTAITGWVLINKIRERNPEVAKGRAEAAEKAGDFKAAVTHYFTAAARTSQRHLPDADVLYARAADLSLEISKKAQTQEDALRYYKAATDGYTLALRENPHNKKVNATLLEERHQQAMFAPSANNWAALEELSTKLIEKSEDGLMPRLHRAEARLRRVQGMPQPTPAALDEVDQDVDEVLKLKPDSGEGVAIRADVLAMRADLGATRRGLVTIKEFQSDETYKKNMADARDLLRGYIKQYGVQPEVASTLARMLLRQYSLSGLVEQAILDEAIKNMEEAVDASADDLTKSYYVDSLGSIYIQTKTPEKAEQLFKRFITKTPEQPLVYFRLASFYREGRDYAKAIESYKDVLKHPLIGMGSQADRNYGFQLEATEGIAWLNMELAEQSTTTAEAQKAMLKEAADYTDKLRTSHAPKGMVELLDGRAQLINRDLNQAVATLRKADADLNGSPGFASRLFDCQLLLARINELQNQPGGALEYVEKALGIKPGDLLANMKKGELLVRMGRLSEARIMFERILGPKLSNEEKYANEDRLPKAFADGVRKLYAAALSDSDNLRSLQNERAYLTLANAQINSDDYESAASNAMLAMEQPGQRDADIQKAYEIAIIANAQLKRQEMANSLVTQALAKFPGAATFQLLKAQLDIPAGTDPIVAQKRIIDSLTDEHLKYSAYGSFYHQQKQYDEEIKILQKAETLIGTPVTPDDRDKLAGVIDRIFSAALSAAGAGRGTPAEAANFAVAQSYFTKAEKLNLDGTGGLLFRGRLELAKSNGKTGIEFLRQAVRANPDFAVAHMVLGQAYLNIAGINNASASTSSSAAAAVTSNKASALEEFRQVVRLSPNNTRAMQITIELLVGNGDSTSMKEAQTLVERGLALAPRHPYFISASEILSGNIPKAIARRVEILDKNPDDLENRRRLAGLYVRLKDEAGTSEALKKDSMDKAIALMDWAYQKNKTDLTLANLLARLLVEYDRSQVGAAKALQIYGTFLASSDPTVRYNAMLAKGEFLHRVEMSGEGYAALRQAGMVKTETPRDEAVAVLTEAVQMQPADSNEAERYLADLLFDLNRWPEAEVVYAKVMEKEKNPTIRQRVVRRYIETELRLDIPPEPEKRVKFKDAITRLDEAIRTDPKDMQALVLRAFASIRQRSMEASQPAQKQHLKTAIEFLNKALLVDPINADALYYRAMATVQVSGENTDNAIRDLMIAAKNERMAVNSRLMLADIYRRSRRYEEASVEYREIMSLRPEMLSVRADYIDFLMSTARQQRTLPADSGEEFVIALRRLDPEGKVFEEIKKASELFPGSQARWLLTYGQLLDMQQKYAEARRIFQSLYEAIPTEATILDSYMSSLNKVSEYPKTIEVATPVLKSADAFMTEHPEWVVLYLRRAAASQALGKKEDATADVDQAFGFAVAAAGKSNYSPFIALLNQGPEALSLPFIADRLRARVAANPSETISKVGLMQILLQMKQNSEALAVCEQTVVPADNVALRTLVLHVTAMVRFQGKKYPEAEKDFLALFKDAPNDIESLNNYAFMLADAMNQPAKAVETAKTSLRILNTEAYETQVMSASASVYDTLGWALFKNGDTQGAIAALQVSVRTQPMSDGFYHLAMAYQKAGKIIEAQQACSEGIKFATTRKDDVLADLRELEGKLK